MSHQAALVLNGGGALGAFQVRAKRYAREVKGCQWSIIPTLTKPYLSTRLT